MNPVKRFLLVYAFLLVLLPARHPDAVTQPQFWAEDGTIFYAEQLQHPGARILASPYRGYLHAVPRLVSATAAQLPTRQAPFAMNLMALVIAAFACALFSLQRYRYLLASDGLRLIVCVIAVTAFQEDELIGTITCVQFYLFPAVLLGILQPPSFYQGKDGWSAYALALVAVAGALSTPLVVLLIPICAWIWWRYRGTAPAGTAAFVALAAVIQIGTFLRNGEHVSHAGPLIEATFTSLVYRVVLVPVIGLRAARSLSAAYFYAVLLMTIVIVTAWLVSLWWNSDRVQRLRILVSVYLITASILLAMARGEAGSFFTPAGIAEWRGERYFFLGCCLFAYLAALSVTRRVPRYAAFVLCVLFAAGAVSNFRTVALADYDWPLYAGRIEQWKSETRAGRTPKAVMVPINPPGWKIELAGIPIQ